MAAKTSVTTVSVEEFNKLASRLAEVEAALLAFPQVFAADLKTTLETQLQPMALRINEAHERIDHAGRVFKELRVALTPPREQPRVKPLPSYTTVEGIDRGDRIAYAQWLQAVDELRAIDVQAGVEPSARYGEAKVIAMARTLQTLRENTAAAAA